MFVFTQGNREFVVPVLEFARALFFHTKAICKYMMTPHGLNNLAVAQKDSPRQGEAEIKFRPDVPLYLIENEQYRQHLTWMLLHPTAAGMFSSIYSRFVQQNNQNTGSSYQRFTFDMVAPDLGDYFRDLYAHSGFEKASFPCCSKVGLSTLGG